MSKHKQHIVKYQKQSRNMFLILTISTAIIALNAIVVTSGLADSYYAGAYSWITTNL